jgi:hypothetical protein
MGISSGIGNRLGRQLAVDGRGEGFSGKAVGFTGCASIFLSRAAPTVPLPSVCARGLP